MLNQLFEMSGHLEVLARRVLYRHPNIKKKLKRKIKHSERRTHTFDLKAWEEYKRVVHSKIHNKDIVLIHSSIDGLSPMGVSVSEVLGLISELTDRGCTVVIPAYPITNLKITNQSMKLYDPLKTLCWTGMLPNAFLKMEGVVRSTIPYNSLAAIGPHAKKMMEDDIDEKYVYGDKSPWNYCVKHQAKILFIGTTPNDSNTIQTHMIADYMKDAWPVKDWYEKITAPVRINGKVIDRELYIQKLFWTQFVADRYINAILKKKKLVKELIVEECPLGIVTNSENMVCEIVDLCKRGKMTYIVPKKYMK